MDERDVEDLLRRHSRRPLRRWLCRCGLRHPCGARRVALDELLRHDIRAVADWYPRYFAGDTHSELAALARLRDPGQWSP